LPLYTFFTQFAECTGTDCKLDEITKKKKQRGHKMASKNVDIANFGILAPF
jgi:hypothetical protein